MRGDDVRDHFVYRAFDSDDGLLYVGCTYAPEVRINRGHRYTSTWFPLAARFRISGPYTYATARRLEREAIRTERSMFNGDTPEYAKVRRTHSALVDRRFQWLRMQNVSMDEALREACEYADDLLPRPGPDRPFLSDDTTIPRAERIDRDDWTAWHRKTGAYRLRTSA